MVKKHWHNIIGIEKIEVTECLDSGSQRIWVKFEPVDKSKPMEICNIVDQPNKVSWYYTNSHFETIDRNKRRNYYAASSAGSLHLDAGKTNILKDVGSKVIVFPLDVGGSLSVYNYSETGSQFSIVTNKPIWVGYAISGSGTINPV